MTKQRLAVCGRTGHDNTWEVSFGAWVDWHRQNPGRLMPQKTVHGGFPTGQWQNDQQKNFRRGVLPHHRAERMRQIRHSVFENQIELAWDESYQACVDFLSESPGARLTHSSVYRGKRIGTWIRNQVAAMNRGTLKGERLARLAALDRRFAKPGSERGESATSPTW